MKKDQIWVWKGRGENPVYTDTVIIGGIRNSRGKVWVDAFPYDMKAKRKGSFSQPIPYDDFKRDFEPMNKGRSAMKKLSKQATLHLLLQGMYKGLQEAKNDPLVQAKYPRGLSFIERMVKDLGKKAGRDANFTLSEKQVKKLNQFLGGSSGVLSAVLRRHIVRHCSGNQCTMVSPNEFRFEYVKPLYHITGEFRAQSDGRDDTTRIDKKVERLSEVLAMYAVSMKGYRHGETEYAFENGVIKMESIHRNRSDVFDVNEMRAELTLFVNGSPLPSALGEQAIRYFQRG